MKIPAFLSWKEFHSVTMKGLKVFFFYLAVLSLFRLIFVAGLYEYLGEGTILSVDLDKNAYQVQFDSIPTPRRISFRAKLEKV